MNKQNYVTSSALAILVCYSPPSLGQISGAVPQHVEAACATARSENGIISAILDELKIGRLSEADRMAEYMLGSDLPRLEKNCLLAVRTSILTLRAEADKREADQRIIAAQETVTQTETRREESDTVVIDSTECVAIRGAISLSNAEVKGMMDSYRMGQLENAKAASDWVLSDHRPNLTGSQIVCAERIVADIRKQQEREAAKPASRLRTVYHKYIAMQACFESRKEFRVQYVTQQEMDTARTITRREEQSLLKKNPALARQKDSLWNQAKVEYGKSNLAGFLAIGGTMHLPQVGQLCRTTAMQYTADKQQQQQQIKKDF